MYDHDIDSIDGIVMIEAVVHLVLKLEQSSKGELRDLLWMCRNHRHERYATSPGYREYYSARTDSTRKLLEFWNRRVEMQASGEIPPPARD